MIVRQDYINAIKPFMNTQLVKILTGVRRAGKSTIFEMVKDELRKSGVNDENIISRNYSRMELTNEYTQKSVYQDLKTNIKDKGRCYLFLDEIQEVDSWEKVVNALLEDEDVDIYVTGSNSKLTSGEISTYLTGRYITIPVYTLSFKEYIEFRGGDSKNNRELLNEYIRKGGFPIVAVNGMNEQSAYQVVEGIYSAVITKDIANRHKIKDVALFNRVVRFIVDNMGKTFSANSIVNYLKSEKRSLTVETIYNYLEWLEQAYIIYPCRRYDLQGKSLLKTQEKYYLSDISFKYSQVSFNVTMIAAAIENIVYLELRRRGYNVFIGKIDAKEIDFVADKRGEKVYIQVCRQIPDSENGREREIGNLMQIKDHYPKYVVSLDSLATGNENGIKIMHLADFLLKSEW